MNAHQFRQWKTLLDIYIWFTIRCQIHVKYQKSLLKSWWISLEKRIDIRMTSAYPWYMDCEGCVQGSPVVDQSLQSVLRAHARKINRSTWHVFVVVRYGMVSRNRRSAYLVMQPAGRRTDRCTFHDIAITLGKRKSGSQARRARDMHRRRPWGRENEKWANIGGTGGASWTNSW